MPPTELRHMLADDALAALFVPDLDVCEWRRRTAQLLLAYNLYVDCMPGAKEEALGKASLQGIRPDLHMAVVAIFLKAAVITAVAMAVSTFAGSTIFTLLATLSIYVIGHLQATARESFLAPPRQPLMQQMQAGEAAPPAPAGSVPLRLATGIVAVIFPDFQVYNVVDAVVEGKTLTWKAIGKMGALSALYLAIYLGAAIFLFAEKEL